MYATDVRSGVAAPRLTPDGRARIGGRVTRHLLAGAQMTTSRGESGAECFALLRTVARPLLLPSSLGISLCPASVPCVTPWGYT